MNKYSTQDLFLNKQPHYSFEELNEPMYTGIPDGWNERSCTDTEVYVSSVRFDFCFPDEKGLLCTAYDELKTFVCVHCCSEGEYTIRTRYRDGMQTEEYLIEITSDLCVITAGDTEGIRRAIYHIEDEMTRRRGPFLPKGVIHRYPHIKKRITRNFFTPHEANLELKDDRDYYPDGYLARLAHEGVNGLWIFVRLRDFIPSDIISEYGKDGEKQIAKLRSVVERCARYGIGVYCLGVEPASTCNNEILSKNHADMLGANFWNTANRAICPSTPKGAAYAKECMSKLFTLVPGLMGFISITTGEAVAGCGGVGTPDEINCPRCKAAGLTKPMALAKTEEYMQMGIKSVAPDAEFISWTYGARSWTDDMLKEHCRVRNKSIALMNNFEDKGTAIQLGKERKTLDYWLSFAGPGEIFELTAQNADGAPIYAKIQVCCSHELPTVPYVPVPGILYDKYKAMLDYGTEGAMYCWFFGNYPGLMNRAAGSLAFLPFYDSKRAFLEETAQLYTDKKSAPVLADAWELFEKSYINCPYNVIFAWYGLLCDSPARPLHLLPIDMAVPSNWLLTQSVEGDRFGETIGMMHTPIEVKTLLDTMLKYWQEGMALIENICIPDEMRTLCEAIAILVESARNTLDFYLMRNAIGYNMSDSASILEDMQKLVIREKENSLALLTLCRKDKRLGYHSEAVGFKFFSEKLLWRVSRLDEVLDGEFPVVRERICSGLSPLAFFDGEGNTIYSIADGKWENFVFENGKIDKSTRIHIDDAAEDYRITIEANHSDDIIIEPEFTMFVPYIPVHITCDANVELKDMQRYFLSEKDARTESAKWRVTKDKNRYIINLSKRDFGLDDGRVFRIAVRREGEQKSFWHIGDNEFFRLAYNRYRPDSKVFIKK